MAGWLLSEEDPVVTIYHWRFKSSPSVWNRRKNAGSEVWLWTPYEYWTSVWMKLRTWNYASLDPAPRVWRETSANISSPASLFASDHRLRQATMRSICVLLIVHPSTCLSIWKWQPMSNHTQPLHWWQQVSSLHSAVVGLSIPISGVDSGTEIRKHDD